MSNRGSTRISRQDLYEQVWLTPMRKLAIGYGVSDVALAKTCRRLEIPVPGRGYWNKVQNGRKVRPRPDLPASKGTQVVTVTRSPPSRPLDETHPAFATCLKALAAGEVLARAVGTYQPHPAVWPKAARMAAARNGDGQEAKTMPVDVGKEHDERARKLLDALAHGLEAKGYKVSVDGVQVEGHCVPIAIVEQQDRVPHAPTARELAKQKASAWDRERVPLWDHKPSGRLSIFSDVYLWPRQDIRKRWSDTRRHRLEDKLDDVLLGLIAIGVAKKQEADERQARERAQAEAYRLHLEHERQLRVAAARAKHVREQATRLAEAMAVRQLISAVQSAAQASGELIDPDLKGWLDVAANVAAQLDPLANGLTPMLAVHEAIVSEAARPAARNPWSS
jgi:hypothetical protein